MQRRPSTSTGSSSNAFFSLMPPRDTNSSPSSTSNSAFSSMSSLGFSTVDPFVASRTRPARTVAAAAVRDAARPRSASSVSARRRGMRPTVHRRRSSKRESGATPGEHQDERPRPDRSQPLWQQGLNGSRFWGLLFVHDRLPTGFPHRYARKQLPTDDPSVIPLTHESHIRSYPGFRDDSVQGNPHPRARRPRGGRRPPADGGAVRVRFRAVRGCPELRSRSASPRARHLGLWRYRTREPAAERPRGTRLHAGRSHDGGRSRGGDRPALSRQHVFFWGWPPPLWARRLQRGPAAPP